MTDSQLFLVIGIPSAVSFIGLLINAYMLGRVSGVEGRITGLESRLTAIESRLAAVESQLAAQKALLDIILKKLDELETKIHS